MVTFASIVGLAMFVVLLIEPFSKTGAHVAEQDAAKGFSDQPVVTLRGPDGKVRDYRVMECNDDYCALFRYGHTFAVQKGEVNWAASPLAVTR